jgi:hypothetical protein
VYFPRNRKKLNASQFSSVGAAYDSALAGALKTWIIYIIYAIVDATLLSEATLKQRRYNTFRERVELELYASKLLD